MDMHKVVKKAGIAAAAIVGAKYLDAKLDLYHDYLLVRAAIIGKLQYVPFIPVKHHLTCFLQSKEAVGSR
jgi:hypothetical protein